MKPIKREINKRNITFWISDSPLTSRRVRIILSNPGDSAKLAEAVRTLRHGRKEKVSFEVSKITNDRIAEETKKLEHAK